MRKVQKQNEVAEEVINDVCEGDDDIAVTESADFEQDNKEEESSGDYEDEDNTDTMISDDRGE